MLGTACGEGRAAGKPRQLLGPEGGLQLVSSKGLPLPRDEEVKPANHLSSEVNSPPLSLQMKNQPSQHLSCSPVGF